MEDVGVFYGHWVYFTAGWSTLWPFGIFYCYLVYLSSFGTLCPEKSGIPGRLFRRQVYAKCKQTVETFRTLQILSFLCESQIFLLGNNFW
jgi:hypothetical protein